MFGNHFIDCLDTTDFFTLKGLYACLLGVAASSPFWRNTMLTKNRRLISANEYITFLQGRKVAKRIVTSSLVKTIFDNGSYVANIEGRSFIYRP